MTEPATDEQITRLEASRGGLDTLSLIARVRLERRRAEAAEAVVEAVRRASIGDLSGLLKSLATYEIAKANGFKEE